MFTCLLLLTAVTSCWSAWTPALHTTFQWQLQGSIDTHVDAAVFDVDLFDAKDSDLAFLKSHGKKIICYFSAGSHEDWRSDAHQFPASVMGSALEGWKGEHWLNVNSPLVRNIMETRLDLAKSRGCDAVEPDNVDGYANKNGLGLSYNDQKNYNIWLANEAHSRGLSVGLKNAVDMIHDLEPHFDWALNEECLSYDECSKYQPFLQHHKAVFHVEYVDNHSQGRAKQHSVCQNHNRPAGFTTLIKDWDLSSWFLTC